MHANPETLFLDNPILTKHLRSRLRPGQVIPTGLVVLVLCLLMAWMGYLNRGFADGSIYSMTMGLQGIILVIIGASQISGSVGGVRETGILDFHRISPVPALVITTGFFLGAPAREYLLCALILPLSAYCASQGTPGWGDWFQAEIGLILLAWVFHGLALLSALMTRKPKANSWGIVIFLVIVFMYGGGFIFSMARGGIPQPEYRFYGVELPWLAFLAIYLVSAIVFLLIASTRKMRSERAHALSKPQAVVFLSTVAVLLLGGVWSLNNFEATSVVVLYGMVLASLPAMVTITPLAGDYARGLRRAQRSGDRHLPPWKDLALNRLTVGVLCLIVLIAASIAAQMLDRPIQFSPVNFTRGINLAIAVGVFVVAYFGLSYQFFAFTAPKRPGTMMALFLFFAWIVPMLAAGIAGLSNVSEKVTITLLSLSPLFGLATSAGAVSTDVDLRYAQLSALLPAIGFAFLFNNLVTVYRRRLELATLDPAELARKAKAFDPFEVEDPVEG